MRFHLVVSEISGNFPATSKISDEFPNDSRALLKTKCPQFRRRLSTSKATEKTTILACFSFFIDCKTVHTFAYSSTSEQSCETRAGETLTLFFRYAKPTLRMKDRLFCRLVRAQKRILRHHVLKKSLPGFASQA